MSYSLLLIYFILFTFPSASCWTFLCIFTGFLAILKVMTSITRVPPGRKKVQVPSNVPEDDRFDRKGHFLKKRDKQKRCKNKPWTVKPKTYCNKCSDFMFWLFQNLSLEEKKGFIKKLNGNFLFILQRRNFVSINRNLTLILTGGGHMAPPYGFCIVPTKWRIQKACDHFTFSI